MYYRYEIRFSDDTPWMGICSELNPSENRRLERFLSVPKWYEKHPNTPSTCWFTEYGFQKYHDRMEAIISNMDQYRSSELMNQIQIRLRKAETLKNIVMCGKVQCIALQV